MQDKPTAAELLEAVREFLEHDLLPELDGRRRFHTRVAANVLGILQREWESEEAACWAEWDRLVALLADEDAPPHSMSDLRLQVAEFNRDLSARIRAGEMDDRWEETYAAVRATVVDKLRIAQPAWLHPGDHAPDAGS